MKTDKVCLTMAFLIGTGLASAGEFHWKGGSGDLLEPSNWEEEVAPTSVLGGGDKLVFRSATPDAEIVTPSGAFYAQQILIEKDSEPLHFKGGQLGLTVGFFADSRVTVDNNLNFYYENAKLVPGQSCDAGGTFVFNGRIDFYKKLFVGGMSSCEINGVVVGSGAAELSSPLYTMTGGKVTFGGKVSIKKIGCEWVGMASKEPIFAFAAPGNVWETCLLAYMGIDLDCVNALDPSVVLTWKDDYDGVEAKTTYRMNGYDQVADRIVSARAGDFTTGYISTTNACTLTLKGSADAETDCCLRGDLSIVWDSAEGHTQTFMNRAHQTTGSLAASNGVLRLAAGAAFASVRGLSAGVNGEIDVATDVPGALAGLQRIDVANGGRVVISSVAKGAFPTKASQLSLAVAGDAALDLPANFALRVKDMAVDGTVLWPGVYGGPESAAEHKLPQLSGTGVVDVRGGGLMILFK